MNRNVADAVSSPAPAGTVPIGPEYGPAGQELRHLRQALRYSEALNDLFAAISLTRQEEEVLGQALPIIARALDAPRALLFRRGDDGWLASHPLGLADTPPQAPLSVVAAAALQQAETDQKPRTVDEAVARALLPAAVALPCLLVPLHAERQPAGVLCLAYPHRTLEHRAAEQAFVLRAAAAINTALVNARCSAAAREQRDLLQRLVDQAPAAISVLDREGRICLTNPQAEALYAHPVPYGEPIESHATLQICHPDGTACDPYDLPLSRSALQGETLRNVELAITWPDGQRRDLLASSAPIRDQRGLLQGAVGVFQDITARKREQRERQRLLRELQERSRQLEQLTEALQESKSHLDRIVETSPDGILLLDAQGRVTFANSAAARITGQPRSTLEGMHYTRFQEILATPSGTYVPPIEFLLEQVAESGHPILGAEQPIRRADGTEVILSVNAAPLPDSPGVVIAFHDITQRVEVERLKTEFLNIASHELRNPLNALRLSLQLLRMRVAKGHHIDQDNLTRIERQTDRLTAMVNDLLEVSRLERGGLVMRPQSMDLAALVASVVDQYQKMSVERPFCLSLPDGPLIVEADPGRIEQVLANLLDNALKYSPVETPVAVELTAGQEAVQVAVIDRGSGIPADQQHRLFTRFYRAGTEATRHQPGLGLGLYICRQIVESHGGRITVESREEQGSTFTFTLPVTASPAPS